MNLCFIDSNDAKNHSDCVVKSLNIPFLVDTRVFVVSCEQTRHQFFHVQMSYQNILHSFSGYAGNLDNLGNLMYFLLFHRLSRHHEFFQLSIPEVVTSFGRPQRSSLNMLVQRRDV